MFLLTLKEIDAPAERISVLDGAGGDAEQCQLFDVFEHLYEMHSTSKPKFRWVVESFLHLQSRGDGENAGGFGRSKHGHHVPLPKSLTKTTPSASSKVRGGGDTRTPYLHFKPIRRKVAEDPNATQVNPETRKSGLDLSKCGICTQNFRALVRRTLF